MSHFVKKNTSGIYLGLEKNYKIKRNINEAVKRFNIKQNDIINSFYSFGIYSILKRALYIIEIRIKAPDFCFVFFFIAPVPPAVRGFT